MCMLDVAVTNKLDNGNVLVVSKDVNMPNSPKEYYSVKEESADRFIKERKSLDFANKFQNTMSVATSIVGGILSASAVKNKIAKGFVGVAAGLGIYKVCELLDEKLNKKSMNNMLTRNDAKDITKEMIEKH